MLNVTKHKLTQLVSSLTLTMDVPEAEGGQDSQTEQSYSSHAEPDQTEREDNMSGASLQLVPIKMATLTQIIKHNQNVICIS